MENLNEGQSKAQNISCPGKKTFNWLNKLIWNNYLSIVYIPCPIHSFAFTN